MPNNHPDTYSTMIISTIQELRFHSPAHALDDIDGMTGFIINSEHETLMDKLGQELYVAISEWYDENRDTVLAAVGGIGPDDYWCRLCLLSQRVVAFDALGRAVGMQQLSVNNSGVNIPVATDYEKPTRDNIDTYRDTCRKECHSAVNLLLSTLEQWCRKDDGSDGDLKRIKSLWRLSRYYYLAGGMLIPSAAVMQEYRNIYDSRERFIQLLPDLRFVQEEQMAPAFGQDFIAAMSAFSAEGTLPDGMTDASLLREALHRLRKAEAALLVERTAALPSTREQRVQAHDDAVRLMDNASAWLRARSSLFPAAVAAGAPWYEAPLQPEEKDSSAAASPCAAVRETGYDTAACWTPPLF